MIRIIGMCRGILKVLRRSILVGFFVLLTQFLAAELVNAVEPKARALIPLEQLASQLKLVKVRVHDPYENKEIEFEGYPAVQVFDLILGSGWRKSDELLMTCLDGYQPSIPASRFLEHRAYFAVRRLDQPDFSLLKGDVTPHKRVALGPLYLVWDNLRDPELRSQGDYGWPYQLSGVEQVDFLSRFPKIAPPARSGARVQKGFLHFRVHCLKCHAINGEGGRVGPELNYPRSVTEYWKAQDLKSWILDPASYRHRTAMPPISRGLPERERVVQEILAYLKAMVSRKITPSKEGGG